jgi:mono/diheme cytochrome c family protein
VTQKWNLYPTAKAMAASRILIGSAAIGMFVAAVVSASLHAQTREPTTPPLLASSVAGKDSFDLYCAPCHGTTGLGDGPVAAALRARPADLTALARRNNGRFPREAVVEYVTGTGRALAAHGTTEMPVWGSLFRAFDPSDVRVQQRIENLVTFLASIQAPSTGTADEGRELFVTYCASCHGTTARGNGPVADSLRRQPPDLTTFTARNGGMFPSERVSRIIDGRDVASHGDREMPIWGDAFRETRGGTAPEAIKRRIDAIVRYLASIQQRAA